MKYTDNGCFYTVNLSANDVATWAQQWPCFGTRRAVWFQFERKSGDLVDMSDDSGMDESGILALSQDAQKWGIHRMNGKPVSFADIRNIKAPA